MSLGNGLTPERELRDPRDGQRIGLLVAAGILLAVPIVALLWVGAYDRVEPTLGGFPFFFWYQFAWVFLCSVFTWTAYRLVLAARSAHRTRGGSAT
jgi:hypothetical protein